MPTGTGCSSRRGPSSSTKRSVQKDVETAGGKKTLCRRRGYLGLKNFQFCFAVRALGTKLQRVHSVALHHGLYTIALEMSYDVA